MPNSRPYPFDEVAKFFIDLLKEDQTETSTFDKPYTDPDNPRRFRMKRNVDESGVSGTGNVAYGCEFSDGSVALRWNTRIACSAVYSSINDLQAIHGHGGATIIEWIDD